MHEFEHFLQTYHHNLIYVPWLNSTKQWVHLVWLSNVQRDKEGGIKQINAGASLSLLFISYGSYGLHSIFKLVEKVVKGSQISHHSASSWIDGSTGSFKHSWHGFESRGVISQMAAPDTLWVVKHDDTNEAQTQCLQKGKSKC